MSPGACIVALGEKVGALYSSDDSLRHGIEAAARRSDEGDFHHITLRYYQCHSDLLLTLSVYTTSLSIGIWAMPLESQYKELIKVRTTFLR